MNEFESHLLATVEHLLGCLRHISLSGSIQGIDPVLNAASVRLDQAKAALQPPEPEPHESPAEA